MPVDASSRSPRLAGSTRPWSASEDLVSRKWSADTVSFVETSIQVEIVFTDALAVEGLLARVHARADGLVDTTVDDPSRPILLAVSDNGPQMTSGSTREFMAVCAIAQHFGRPGAPTEQAWIESLFGHIKAEFPHLCPITDPAVLRTDLAVVRTHFNATRLPAGIGYVTPLDAHEGRGAAIREALQAGLEAALLRRSPTIETEPSSSQTGDPTMLAYRNGTSIAKSETGQPCVLAGVKGERKGEVTEMSRAGIGVPGVPEHMVDVHRTGIRPSRLSDGHLVLEEDT